MGIEEGEEGIFFQREKISQILRKSCPFMYRKP
jgi:hypothetical protein